MAYTPEQAIDPNTNKPFPAKPSFSEQAQPTLSRIGKFLWQDPMKPSTPGVQTQAPAAAPKAPAAAPYDPWTSAPSHSGWQAPSAAPKAPVSAPGLPSIPAAGQMPDYVKSNVKSMGQDPSQFHAIGSQLISARTPEAIQADVTAHPPITTAYGQSLVSPKPAASQPIGVEGAAVPGQAQPGVQSAAQPQVDPARAALHSALRSATADQERNGQGKWVFPPGTGTEAYYQPTNAAERIFGLTNALANHNQTDPAAKIGLLHGIAHSDPATRGVGLASIGVTPDQAASIPRPAAQGEPTGQDGMYDPAAAAAYQDPNATLHDHIMRTAKNPSPANDAALRNHIARRRLADPEALADEMYVPQKQANLWDASSQWLWGPNRSQREVDAGFLKRLGIDNPGLTQ